MPDIKITSDGVGFGSKILIDGVDISNVVNSISFKLTPTNEAPSVSIGMYASSLAVEIEKGTFSVEFIEALEKALGVDSKEFFRDSLGRALIGLDPKYREQAERLAEEAS